MKERPILFSAGMVRAILEGRKTQTRRVVKPQPEPIPSDVPIAPFDNGWWWPSKAAQSMVQTRDMGAFCPYGRPGERLYVKETFFAWGRWETRYNAEKGRDEWHFIDMTLECGKRYRYAVDHVGDNGPRKRGGVTPQWWKRPAIFMPRHASRILLEVTAVRVERLNDISEKDAIAEGIGGCLGDYLAPGQKPGEGFAYADGRGAFRHLWQSINGPGSWEANPWVWVVEFKKLGAGETVTP